MTELHIGDRVIVKKGTIFHDQETMIEEVYRNMGTVPWYRLAITKLCLFRQDEIEPVTLPVEPTEASRD